LDIGLYLCPNFEQEHLLYLMPSPQGTPANIRMYLIGLIALHFAADSIGFSSLTYFWWVS